MERRKTVEHDVDILLVEELYVSPEFRQWLVKKATGEEAAEIQVIEARRSVSETTLGESDVVFVYTGRDGARRAILIEDKVTAPAQPAQGDRYRRRGESGKRSGEWDDFSTMILAPQEYLDQSADAARFDTQLSYESLCDWLLQVKPDDDRMNYKAGVVERGIQRMKAGWVRRGDEMATQFFRDYWQFACSEFPRLGMKEPFNIPKGHNEISFFPGELDKRHGLRLAHKFEKGHVDLMVAGAAERCGALRRANQATLPSDVTVVTASKSAAFGVILPAKMNREKPFAPQETIARNAMDAAVRLLGLSFKLNFAE
jgi:hypothetical protein